MPKRRVKERRKRAHEFKRLVQMHGGRKGTPKEQMTPTLKEVDEVGYNSRGEEEGDRGLART